MLFKYSFNSLELVALNTPDLTLTTKKTRQSEQLARSTTQTQNVLVETQLYVRFHICLLC